MTTENKNQCVLLEITTIRKQYTKQSKIIKANHLTFEKVFRSQEAFYGKNRMCVISQSIYKKHENHLHVFNHRGEHDVGEKFGLICEEKVEFQFLTSLR